jgi:hypothetical protein
MQTRSVCVLVFLGSFALPGQDVISVAPAGVVKVEYDDPQVRVLRLHGGARRQIAHALAPAYVAAALTNGVSRYTFPDGRSSKEKTMAGQAIFSQAVTHASENQSLACAEWMRVCCRE